MREISPELLGSFRLSIDFQFIIPDYPLFPLPLSSHSSRENLAPTFCRSPDSILLPRFPHPCLISLDLPGDDYKG